MIPVVHTGEICKTTPRSPLIKYSSSMYTWRADSELTTRIAKPTQNCHAFDFQFSKFWNKINIIKTAIWERKIKIYSFNLRIYSKIHRLISFHIAEWFHKDL